MINDDEHPIKSVHCRN